MLRKGAIEVCEDCEGQFISSYFLVPKPDGSNRFILNLNELNKFIKAPHFKLEDIRSALGLLSLEDFLESIDLKDAYYLMSIFIEHRKYLRFKFKGKTFQFLCLPFGLCTCPYTFTKVMKLIVNTLRLKGMVLVLYLDDFLFIEKYKNTCENNMREAVKIVEYFGLVNNYEKSSLSAKQQCKYLGFTIDTINFSLNLPNKKKSQIVKLLEGFKLSKMYKIRKFAKLLGVLTSACPAVAYGFIHCKRLERQKFLALKFNGGNYESKILITDSMMEDLAWWKSNVIIGSCPIRTHKYTLEIFFGFIFI